MHERNWKFLYFAGGILREINQKVIMYVNNDDGIINTMLKLFLTNILTGCINTQVKVEFLVIQEISIINFVNKLSKESPKT